MKNIRKLTLDWLEQHNTEYDEIYLRKPNGKIYIDDGALQFQLCYTITEIILKQEVRGQ